MSITGHMNLKLVERGDGKMNVNFVPLTFGEGEDLMWKEFTGDEMTQRLNDISEFQEELRSLLKNGRDYGTISNSTKPVLLKPGAEKILMLTGMRPSFEIVRYMSDEENGLLQYQVKCELYLENSLICEGLGSSNTRESVYTGLNPFDVDNTALKMAKKRALIDATLLALGISDMFTQDEEVLRLNNCKEGTSQTVEDRERKNDTISRKQAGRMFGLSRGKGKDAQSDIVKSVLTQYGYRKSSDVKKSDYDRICSQIEDIANERWDKLYERNLNEE